MKKSVAAVLVLAVLAGAAGWCAGHHVVRTDQGVLVLAKRLKQAGGKLVIYGMQPHVREVFDISGFMAILNVVATRDDAVAQL